MNDVLKITIIVWVLISQLYLGKTLPNERTHDLTPHVDYTYYLMHEHKIPDFSITYVAQHPPVFYLISGFISKSLIGLEADRNNHINLVRFLSTIYGAIGLLIIGLLLSKSPGTPFSKLLILLYTCTTPKFMYVFSTYNNDALITLLFFFMIFLIFKLYQRWSNLTALVLFLTASIAAYTKNSTLFTIPEIFILYLICYHQNLLKKDFKTNHIKILSVLFLGLLTIFPYAYFHNYKQYKKLFPFTGETWFCENIQPSDFIRNIDYLTTYNSNKWAEPWAFKPKKTDYLSFSIITSVIGEYTYVKPNVLVIWGLLILSLLIHLYSFFKSFKILNARPAIYIILITHLINFGSLLFLKTPLVIFYVAALMDYRYIAWLWLPWAIVINYSLEENKNISLLRTLLGLGIILNLYTLYTVKDIENPLSMLMAQ